MGENEGAGVRIENNKQLFMINVIEAAKIIESQCVVYHGVSW